VAGQQDFGHADQPRCGPRAISGEIDATDARRPVGAEFCGRNAEALEADSTDEDTVDIIVAGFNCAGKRTAKDW
jgi:hypothetical protein